MVFIQTSYVQVKNTNVHIFNRGRQHVVKVIYSTIIKLSFCKSSDFVRERKVNWVKNKCVIASKGVMYELLCPTNVQNFAILKISRSNIWQNIFSDGRLIAFLWFYGVERVLFHVYFLGIYDVLGISKLRLQYRHFHKLISLRRPQ